MASRAILSFRSIFNTFSKRLVWNQASNLSKYGLFNIIPALRENSGALIPSKKEFESLWSNPFEGIEIKKTIEDAILNINTHQRMRKKLKKSKRRQRRRKYRSLSDRKKKKLNLI
jgi:hypothetical protein